MGHLPQPDAPSERCSTYDRHARCRCTRVIGRRSKGFLRAQIAVAAALGLSLALASSGCGGGSGSSGSAGAPQAAPSCRLAAALHEHQFARSDELRATPSDVVIGRLETGAAGEPVAASDSGRPGVDVLPYRIVADTELRLGIVGGTAGTVRLLDASGRIVAETLAGEEESRVSIAAGDYTLEITSDGSRAAHYLVMPRACAGASASGTSTAHATQAADDATTPGVYVTETGASGAVSGASTSVAAFVGSIGAGPIGQATQLTSVDDLTSSFTTAAAASPVGVAVAQFFANGGSIAWVVGTASASVNDVVGTFGAKSGLYALDAASGWSLLVLPDLATMSPTDATTLLQTAVPLAIRANAFTIVDAPQSLVASMEYGGWVIESLVPTLPGPLPPQSVLPFAATYYPQIVVQDASGAPSTVSAGGAIAGVFAANDGVSGVWVDPAGSPNGVFDAVVSASTVLDDADVATLLSESVNAIRSGPALGTSTVLFGARTLGDASMNGASVAASRTDLYVRASLQESLQWVVFEPNDEMLWQAVTQQVTAFLTTLWSEGGLAGSTAAEAFVVTCDASDNPPEQLLNGELVVEVEVQIVGDPEPTQLTFTFAVEASGA